jgi:hypothetical protein
MLDKTTHTHFKTKKERILSIFKRTGIRDLERIAGLADAKPSYVASVLRQENLIDSYFDLYTSTGLTMNAYSKHFQGRLGFKNVETAERGVSTLEAGYRHYEDVKDRAGQHHALEMGLTMLDRARWTGKLEEAEVYRRWLVAKLSTPLANPARPAAVAGEQPLPEKAVEDNEPLRHAA